MVLLGQQDSLQDPWWTYGREVELSDCDLSMVMRFTTRGIALIGFSIRPGELWQCNWLEGTASSKVLSVANVCRNGNNLQSGI